MNKDGLLNPHPPQNVEKSNQTIINYSNHPRVKLIICKIYPFISTYMISNIADSEIIYTSLTNEYATSNLPHLPVGMPLHPVKGFDPQLRAKSNREIVTNRQDLRIANINAAQLLKAELNSPTRDLQPSVTTASTANINTVAINQTDSDVSEISSIKQDTEDSNDEIKPKRKADELDDDTPIVR